MTWFVLRDSEKASRPLPTGSSQDATLFLASHGQLDKKPGTAENGITEKKLKKTKERVMFDKMLSLTLVWPRCSSRQSCLCGLAGSLASLATQQSCKT